MPHQTSFLKHPIFIIFAGCMIGILTFGPRSAMGLLLPPMTEAFQWDRELFGFAIAIQNLMWGIGQPLAGAISDRFGTTRVLISGALIYALGLFWMANASDPTSLTLSAGLIIGLGISGSAFFLVIAAFARLVPEKWHGLAFGMGTASGSLGQFIFNPLGQSLINDYGYQFALYFMVIAVLLTIFFSLVLNGKNDSKTAAGEFNQTLTQAISEAIKNNSYILLNFGFFVCGFHVSFIAIHLPAYISDIGFDAKYGAWALALIGAFNIIGSIIAGVIGAKFKKRYLLSSIYIARAIIIFLFIFLPQSPATLMIFAASMGLLWLSTVPLTYGILMALFGNRYAATLFGFVFLSHQIGSFLGVWLGGKLFDQTGSYDSLWWFSIALGVFAAIVHLPIKETPVIRPTNQTSQV